MRREKEGEELELQIYLYRATSTCSRKTKVFVWPIRQAITQVPYNKHTC